MYLFRTIAIHKMYSILKEFSNLSYFHNEENLNHSVKRFSSFFKKLFIGHALTEKEGQ